MKSANKKAVGLSEVVVDLRRLHTIRLDVLRELCVAGNHKGRIRVPYREHLGRHFEETFGRIVLPKPYETM